MFSRSPSGRAVGGNVYVEGYKSGIRSDGMSAVPARLSMVIAPKSLNIRVGHQRISRRRSADITVARESAVSVISQSVALPTDNHPRQPIPRARPRPPAMKRTSHLMGARVLVSSFFSSFNSLSHARLTRRHSRNAKELYGG